jgi:hypothetical protein
MRGKLEIGHVYNTLNDDTVRILCVDVRNSAYPIIGLSSSGPMERELIQMYTPKGHAYGCCRGNDIIGEVKA